MKIQLLYFDDCPNYESTRELVEEAVDDLDIDAELELIRIDSPDSAVANRFLGSPTVKVDGVDIDPAARRRDDFGFSCRTYGASGIPPRDMIVNALTRLTRGEQ